MSIQIIFLWFVVTAIIMVIVVVYGTKKQEQKLQNNMNWFERQGYKITKKVDILCIDEGKKKWFLSGINTIFDYSDIIDFEIIEDGKSYKSKNGVLRAAVGGMAFGVVGAIVGASTAKQESTINYMDLIITTRNISKPTLTIHVISSPTKTDSLAYRNACQSARQIIAQLTIMRDKAQNPQYSKWTPYEISTPTKVVGVTQDNDEGKPIQKILPTLSQYSSLKFIREPDNPHDKNAIKVYGSYQHIGYINADLAKEIAPLMDQGKELNGNISEVTGGGEHYYGCNIHISI